MITCYFNKKGYGKTYYEKMKGDKMIKKLRMMNTSLTTDEVVKINEIIENVNSNIISIEDLINDNIKLEKRINELEKQFDLVSKVVNILYEVTQDYEGDENEN